MTQPRVVVCGGGVTGLTAAYRVAKARGTGAGITVFEASERFGGSLVTVRRDGLVFDGGADAFVAAKPQAVELCRELGLGERLQETRPESRNVYFLRRGRLVRLPEGLVLAVPTRFLPLIESPLFSLLGVARMGLDLVLPRRSSSDDESIGSFLGRRLGAEAVEILGEPLLAGIFSGDPNRLSMAATFPQLVELERKHRSLVLGALAARAKAPRPKPARPPSAFLGLQGGMGELIEALQAKLRELGCELVTQAPTERVERGERGLRVTIGRAGGAEVVEAERVLLSMGAGGIARAIDGLVPEAARELRKVPHVSTASLLLAYERRAVAHPLDASGVLIPRSERRECSAITFMSTKWAQRAPDDVALLRVFFGGHARPEVRFMTDGDLVQLAKAELAAVLGITGEPIAVEVFRWNDCRPQPVVGHNDRVKRVRELLGKQPGLFVAGSAFDGVGIADCIRQATEVAKQLVS